MDEVTAKTILDEAVGTTLATDEGQKYLEAQGRQMEVLSLVEAHNPRAAQHLRTLLLQYMWQQITPFTLQATLHDIYSTHPFLHTPSTYDPIRPFLEHEIATPEDEAKTKGLLREAWGTLTQSAPEGVDPVRNWGKDMGVLKDIQERFKDQPGKYEGFIRVVLGEWREGRPATGDSGREVRKKVEEMLKGEPELLERFREIYTPKEKIIEGCVEGEA